MDEEARCGWRATGVSYLGEVDWWSGRLAFIAMSLPCLAELRQGKAAAAVGAERGGEHTNIQMVKYLEGR